MASVAAVEAAAVDSEETEAIDEADAVADSTAVTGEVAAEAKEGIDEADAEVEKAAKDSQGVDLLTWARVTDADG